MADIGSPIIYRGAQINTVANELRVLDGITVEVFDYSVAEAVGYMEKRAASDGMYASDVYVGARFIDLSGHVYGSNLARLFDHLHLIRSVFSPTSAYAQSPGEKGFMPLVFTQPTEADGWDTEGFVQTLMIYARPMGLPRFTIVRDRIAGEDSKPQAIPWQVRLVAKDPRVYVTPEKTRALAGAAVASPQDPKLIAINRGDYAAPLNILLAVGAAPGTGKKFRLTGFGVDMTINMLNEANRAYRWYGDNRVLMVASSTDPTEPEALRMDLVNWNAKDRFPAVPAGESTYTYTHDVTLIAASRLFWSEAFA